MNCDEMTFQEDTDTNETIVATSIGQIVGITIKPKPFKYKDYIINYKPDE